MKPYRPAPLLSNSEAAAALGLKPRALEQLRNRGGGPKHTYVGRFPRYTVHHIDEYLMSRSKTPTQTKA